MLKRELMEKLDWYTMYASEKEYDEKAVESILYLLDHIDPLEEGSVPSSEEAWERFRKREENARELLPLDGKEAAALREEIRRLGKNESGASRNESSTAGRNESSTAGRNESSTAGRNESSAAGRNESSIHGGNETIYEDGIRAFTSGGERAAASNAIGGLRVEMAGDSSLAFRLDGRAMGAKRKDSVPPGKKGRTAGFMRRCKAAAAVLFLVTALAVGGSLQAGAVKNDGFFFWLKRDETGTEMITSPEMLGSEASMASEADPNCCYNRNDVPVWAQDWLKIETKFEMPANYEWQYFEIKELDFIKYIIGHYADESFGDEILLGAHIYAENVFYNRDRYANYDYVDSYEADQKQMDIYNKVEETGEIYYAICFYEGNCKYFVSMKDNLDELKGLAERYWSCIKLF